MPVTTSAGSLDTDDWPLSDLPATGRRAIVVGASIGGLFTAAFLRRIGWSATVYERSATELSGRGAGIFASHPELIEALGACGASATDLGVVSPGRVVLDRAGRTIARLPMLQIVSSWDRIRSLVAEVVDSDTVRYGYDVASIENQTGGVRVQFSNGETAEADLLIGADGFLSTVRGYVDATAAPQYAGYFLWRGAPAESALSTTTRSTIFDRYAFYLADQLQVLGYPIPGVEQATAAGQRRYNLAWFRVADAATLAEMCVDDEGRSYEYSVPPPRVRADLVEQMRSDAENLLPPQFRDCVDHIDRPFFTPIYDVMPQRLTAGRLALVGDAAATVRPHAGFGVSKAACEAFELARSLLAHQDVDQALQTFEEARLPLAQRLVHHGRLLGAQLGVDLANDEEVRMNELLQDPEEIMRRVAVPSFLTPGGTSTPAR